MRFKHHTVASASLICGLFGEPDHSDTTFNTLAPDPCHFVAAISGRASALSPVFNQKHFATIVARSASTPTGIWGHGSCVVDLSRQRPIWAVSPAPESESAGKSGNAVRSCADEHTSTVSPNWPCTSSQSDPLGAVTHGSDAQVAGPCRVGKYLRHPRHIRTAT